MSDDNRRCGERRSWVISKEISIPHIVTLVSALCAVVVSWASLDKRLAVIESSLIIVTQKQQIQDADRSTIRSELRDSRNELRQDLAEVARKLDRLVEGISRTQR